jgi:hypothetical protein
MRIDLWKKEAGATILVGRLDLCNENRNYLEPPHLNEQILLQSAFRSAGAKIACAAHNVIVSCHIK